jgi:precorrin-3B C17-methyltransferase
VAFVSGSLTVIGLGPGADVQVTPEAAQALDLASVVYGYGPYLERVPARPGQRREASDNREEIGRATLAIQDAIGGARVAVVSGGDPGVFAMAAAICEALERGPPQWTDLDLVIVPGITSMLAVAARVGAPLGHDFCALSLSNNLKPWSVIEQRLTAAASVGFAIALYNPTSRARPWQLKRAFELLSAELPPSTPVVFGRGVGRATERIVVTTLDAAADCEADMATCILIGSAETRLVQRSGRSPLVYTPRSLGESIT